MDREATADWVSATYGTTLVAYGFFDDDSTDGFGLALDDAFLAYLINHSYDTSTLDYDIPAADLYCFKTLVTTLIYDMLLPKIALTEADFSVDAPLTNVKKSQIYRQMKDLRDASASRAYGCGYFTTESEVGGMRVNLDFKEPGICVGTEF